MLVSTSNLGGTASKCRTAASTGTLFPEQMKPAALVGVSLVRASSECTNHKTKDPYLPSGNPPLAPVLFLTWPPLSRSFRILGIPPVSCQLCPLPNRSIKVRLDLDRSSYLLQDGNMKGTPDAHDKHALLDRLDQIQDARLAEREGFEPTCPLLAGKTLSRRPVMTTLVPLRGIGPLSHRIIEPLLAMRCPTNGTMTQ